MILTRKLHENIPTPTLGEGWGEGLAKPKILFLLFYRSGHEKEWRRVFFVVTQLRPHPNPLPKGEEVYLQNLGTPILN